MADLLIPDWLGRLARILVFFDKTLLTFCRTPRGSSLQDTFILCSPPMKQLPV